MVKYTIGAEEVYDGSAALTLFDHINTETPIRERRNYKAEEPLEHFRAPIASPLPMIFLLSILLAASIVLFSQYLQLRNSVINTATDISQMETRLADLTRENDETYNRITESIDYGEIRRVATQELHMTEPESTQIVSVPVADDDYVHQYSDFK